jgi:hypothetical protein
MSKAGKRLGQALSYPAFMQRQRVLGLYRSMLKSVQRIDRSDIRVDISQQIKSEFTNNKNVKDAVSLRSLMSEGSRQLEVLKDMESSPSSTFNPVYPNNPAVTSWLDSSTEDDIKGRVGEGWPWQQ